MAEASERSESTGRVNYVPGGPEALFHVGDVEEVGGSATGSMETGPWTMGPGGRPALGSLGVLLDVVLGAAAIANRPPGFWAVTTQILLDACAPMPSDGSPLSALARTVHQDQTGALAQGSVIDQNGRLVALASTRVRYTPGQPTGANRLPDDFELESARAIPEMLGVEPSDDGLTLATTLRTSNPMGNFHGGIALCLADLAGWSSVRSDDHPLDTSSLHITYLRPGPITGAVRVVAEPAHRGRTLATVHVRCLRSDGKPFALATITYQ
jgi:uncharacterized protein (TIGR00369 family)